MNVIGNRCTAQTNFHKPHCRSEHYSPHPFNGDAGAHCAPLRDNVASGNKSLQTPVQVDFAIEQSGLPFGLGACLPVRWWIRFAAAKPRWLKQPTGLFLRADAPFRARV